MLAGGALIAIASLAGDAPEGGTMMNDMNVGAEGHHRPHRRTPPPTPAPTPSPPSTTPPASYVPTPAPSKGYTFTDEFAGAAGVSPSENWAYDLGAGGWGNGELETYTSSAANAHLDGDGHLAVTVTANGKGYDSARLVTRGIFTQMYGSFEAGIKLSPVTGLWPAFWLLGVNAATWPACGELDVMENYGGSLVSSTINNGSVGWLPQLEADTTDDGGWHIYRCTWEPGTVSMYKDNVLLQTQTPKTVSGDWPYDNSSAMGGGLYVILNVAVGGSGTGGATPPASALPAVPMLVDYVHAWEPES